MNDSVSNRNRAKCAGCGFPVSYSADWCPNCGRLTPVFTWVERGLLRGGLLLAWVIVALMFVSTANN